MSLLERVKASNHRVSGEEVGTNKQQSRGRVTRTE